MALKTIEFIGQPLWANFTKRKCRIKYISKNEFFKMLTRIYSVLKLGNNSIWHLIKKLLYTNFEKKFITETVDLYLTHLP